MNIYANVLNGLIMQMSEDDFIKNNHGIDDGKDLSEGYMRSLYERILGNEIKLKDDFTSDDNDSLYRMQQLQFKEKDSRSE